MLRKFFPFIKNNSRPSDQLFNPDLIRRLFVFLIEKVSVPKNAEQLIQLANKAHTKKIEEVLNIYLLFEKYLTSFEKKNKFSTTEIRHLVLSNFPELGEEKTFEILFLSYEEQKNKLAIQFLKEFLVAIFEKFGRVGDGYLEKKSFELRILGGKSCDPGVFRTLQVMSFEIFRFISKNYGEALAAKIFEKNYESFSSRFKELEVFPYLVTMVPKEIASHKHLGIFTQSQIEQVFLEKLAESEKLNTALQEKIRENAQTQTLLKRNEIMLGSVIASALDAIVIINEAGQVIRWNTAATEIFGYTEKEMEGQNFVETIIPISLQQAYVSGFRKILTASDGHFLNKRLELVGRRKNGEEFPAEVTITPIQQGLECNYSGFIRDISGQKRREVELIQMKEKAEQAARAKSQFLSVMSHELRTPLNAVIGFTQLLLENNPRPDQHDDLSMLQFSGESLLGIINDILDFNKLESGKVEMRSVDFNLKEFVQSLYQSFSYKAKEKKIVFDVEYDELMPFSVRGDSLRLSQVLNNLISNAIKFTNEGQVKLKIELVREESDMLVARFVVSDTGIGIASENQQRIFEQFTQADGDTTRLFGGTGLGLAIVLRLVELMGSKIVIDSVEGKGSRFHFDLMLQKCRQSVSSGLQKLHLNHQTAFLNRNILLAEDNAFNANIAGRIITGWGARMDVARDGQQALEFALRRHYDLILMDVQMPVMDGFECSRAIRKHMPDIPIIAVTASPIMDVLEQIKSSGMNDYVSKPYKPSELFNRIERYLQYPSSTLK